MATSESCLFLEKAMNTHYIYVETRKGPSSIKSFSICLDRANMKEYAFFNRIKKFTENLPQSLSVIEPVNYKTHRIRLFSIEKRKSRVFHVSLPGYDSKDIARELYKYCKGGKDPKW